MMDVNPPNSPQPPVMVVVMAPPVPAQSALQPQPQATVPTAPPRLRCRPRFTGRIDAAVPVVSAIPAPRAAHHFAHSRKHHQHHHNHNQPLHKIAPALLDYPA
jgi:hypothetical protein